MFCPSCGAPVSNGSHFCTSCGTPIAAPAPQPALVPVVALSQPQPQPASKPSVPGRGLGIASMIMGFASIHCLVISPYFMVAAMSTTTAFISYLDTMMRTTLVLTLMMYLVLPILGIVFSRGAMQKGYICKMSKSGMIMSVISLAAFIPALLFIIYI